MQINYWDCKFCDYNEEWDGEEEIRIYGCSNKENGSYCQVNNKWNDKKGECIHAINVT